LGPGLVIKIGTRDEPTNELDEVIETMNPVFKEAGKSGECRWDTSQANRWIDQRRSG
jgi:hypothetical protein